MDPCVFICLVYINLLCCFIRNTSYPILSVMTDTQYVLAKITYYVILFITIIND